MIRRSVRKRFHSLHWIPPSSPIESPSILVPNHHGWDDGYILFHAITRLGLRCVDWIAEYDTFPLFGKIGGMPFPANDPVRRVATVRKTIRLMREDNRNLILFAEGALHRPPHLLRFGKALRTVATQVKEATVIPVAIKYEYAMHERPEAFVIFGKPVEPGELLESRTRDAVEALLAELTFRIRQEPDSFELLARGTRDVNERWDMRNIPGMRQ